ncbi:MAG: competence/damage-inducible protein A, partial [Gemmatimonadales bacterium]
MNIELVTVGTELLLGFTVDTNSAWMGKALAAVGVPVVRRTSIGDSPDAIRDAIDAALQRTGFVITTGGLGPTRDDITKNVVADLLGMPLQFDDAIWAMLTERWARFGRKLVESNRTQAMVPRGATVLTNHWGSAPGLWLESPRGVVVMLPGVPGEMIKLMEHEVLPRLATRGDGTVIRSTTVRTSGIGESVLAEGIGVLEDELAPLTLAYLPGVAGVDLRVDAWGLSPAEADARLADASARLHHNVGVNAWGDGEDDLAALLLVRLRARGLTLAVAESCTGGMLGARLTEVPGSSDVFIGGVLTYSNASKVELAGVPVSVLEAHGAVSQETAEALVAGVAARLATPTAVSITGIAGPGGGSEEKPVGLVWIATLADGEVQSRRLHFSGDRGEIRARAVQTALFDLWRRV